MSTEKNSKTGIYMKICQRAEKLGYKGDFLSLMMDIESADKKFNLRLNDLLDADNFNFLHDVYGIVNNIVRDEYPAKSFGFFVPRFAGCSQPDFIAGKNEEETQVNQEGEVCQK